jgi:hypothetical protein
VPALRHTEPARGATGFICLASSESAQLSGARRRVCAVGPEQVIVDPVSAAHRLLGAIPTGGGLRAVVVEVEAYGGMPDGPWPDAAGRHPDREEMVVRVCFPVRLAAMHETRR